MTTAPELRFRPSPCTTRKEDYKRPWELQGLADPSAHGITYRPRVDQASLAQR
ncbi:hypothetical protein OHA33_33995 [Streptomyces sp. NBC_00562]|uniref:hypothetical protein n=1 Tax=Streptomyces sp. NBC_00562 TaxID=2975777 RepID=UPI002E814BE2|nr:hypothetical protein [Streptomyces sp. NBC_00562]WUC23470.1 hypothetical protein OHA33_33995 [Streptomyces sp. NBC_00562]